MLKLRSGGSKGSRSSRSSSVEAEDPPQRQPGTFPGTELLAGTGVFVAEMQGVADGNSLAVRNTSTVPSTPPPSYEHVLEETRMEHSKEEEQEEETEEEADKPENQKDKNVKVAENRPSAVERVPARGPEILHKSSKEFYKAVAKQWGITCKMSDHCRCFDCQSRYFDCEYEEDEEKKTDGGLGAGTPMFISEVMHGTACVLL